MNAILELSTRLTSEACNVTPKINMMYTADLAEDHGYKTELTQEGFIKTAIKVMRDAWKALLKQGRKLIAWILKLLNIGNDVESEWKGDPMTEAELKDAFDADEVKFNEEVDLAVSKAKFEDIFYYRGSSFKYTGLIPSLRQLHQSTATARKLDLTKSISLVEIEKTLLEKLHGKGHRYLDIYLLESVFWEYDGNKFLSTDDLNELGFKSFSKRIRKLASKARDHVKKMTKLKEDIILAAERENPDRVMEFDTKVIVSTSKGSRVGNLVFPYVKETNDLISKYEDAVIELQTVLSRHTTKHLKWLKDLERAISMTNPTFDFKATLLSNVNSFNEEYQLAFNNIKLGVDYEEENKGVLLTTSKHGIHSEEYSTFKKGTSLFKEIPFNYKQVRSAMLDDLNQSAEEWLYDSGLDYNGMLDSMTEFADDMLKASGKLSGIIVKTFTDASRSPDSAAKAPIMLMINTMDRLFVKRNSELFMVVSNGGKAIATLKKSQSDLILAGRKAYNK